VKAASAGLFAQHAHQMLRVQPPARLAGGQLVQPGARLAVMGKAGLQMRVLGLVGNQRQQRLQRGPPRPARQLQIGAAAQHFGAHVHLGDFRALRVELAIGKSVPSISSTSQAPMA
jgi:hypothetical protein